MRALVSFVEMGVGFVEMGVGFVEMGVGFVEMGVGFEMRKGELVGEVGKNL